MATKKKTSAGSSKATSQKLAKIEVFATPTKPKHECLNNTFKFFKYGIESANHLWEVYKNLTKQRGKGAPSRRVASDVYYGCCDARCCLKEINNR